MTRKPTASQALAQQAALAATDTGQPATEPKRKTGRPRGKREVEAVINVRLTKARLDDLRRISAKRCVPVHAVIISGIDMAIELDGRTSLGIVLK